LSQVTHTGFLCATARIGHDENPELGVENLAKLVDRALKNDFKILTAMGQHWPGLVL
jgi:hypothetical protein